MKQILSFCFLVLFVAGYLLSQPIVQFDKTYGGRGCEDGRSAKQTPDLIGCTVIYSLTIDVPVVTCGNGKKVLICHTPPGNPENPQTICISPNALPAHLAQGDCVGACMAANKNADNYNFGKDKPEIQEHFSVFPNPSKDKVTFSFLLNVSGYTVLELYDNTGKKIAILFEGYLKTGENKKLEYSVNGLPEGLYIASLRSSTEYRLLKFVVQN